MKKNLQRTFKKLIQILFKSIYGKILYLNNKNSDNVAMNPRLRKKRTCHALAASICRIIRPVKLSTSAPDSTIIKTRI